MTLAQIARDMHPLAWAGAAMVIIAPAMAIVGFMTFSGRLYSRPTLAAAGLLAMGLAFAFAGGGALLVRVG